MYSALVGIALLAQIGDSSRLARLDSALAQEASAGFSGVVLIGDSTGVKFAKAYGKVKALGVPGDIPFWLASDSKMFAAAAALRLQQHGKLRLQDSIGRFVGDVPEDKRGITIHQLLSHTSGLPHQYRADGVVDREEAVAAILRLPLLSKPGEKYSYSNDGYTLLAAIVEIASRVSFDGYIVDSLLMPAAMKRSGVWGMESVNVPIAPVANPARIRTARPTIMKDGKSVANWGYRGPTGIFSTARDLYIWIQKLQTGRVISDSLFHQQVGRHSLVRSDSIAQTYMGYGLGVRVEGGRDTWYSHAGNEEWLGHTSIVRFTPGGDIMIVLSNSGDVDGSAWSGRASRKVREIVYQGH